MPVDYLGLENKYKLPAGLLEAVRQAESGGNPLAVSPKGARGPFQFMPDTAAAYGLADPTDEEAAADAAARMFADLHKQYQGDLPKMLAGYNWGSGNMAKQGFDNMPAETRNYITKVQGFMPKQYAQAQTTANDAGGMQPLTFDDIPDAPQLAQPLTFDDIADPFDPAGKSEDELLAAGYYTAQNPRNPNAKIAPPLGGAGPGGRDLQWFEQPVPKPPAPEMTVTDRLKLGTQAVGRGAADVLGMPSDLAALVANTGIAGANIFGAEIPYIEKPLGGSDALADSFGGIYEKYTGDELIDPEQLGSTARMGYNINRFGTGALLPGAGLATKASKIPMNRAGLSPRLEPFVDPYIKNAPRALATDVAAGAGSGAGVAAAEEYAPDSPLATLAGAIFGGSTGATGAGLTNAFRDAGAQGLKNYATGGFKFDTSIPRDPETGMPVNRKVANEAAGYLQGQAENIDTAKANLTDAVKFYTENDLPMPGTGAMSDDVGLIGVERGARTQEPTPFLKRDRDVREAQGERLRQMGPNVPEEQKRIAQTFAKDTADTQMKQAQSAVDTARGDLAAGQRTLEQAKEAEATLAAPVAAQRGNEGQASAQLDKEIVGGALEPKTQKKNAAFDAIDPEKQIERDVTPIADLVGSIKARANKLSPNEQLPSEFVAKLDAITGENGTGKASLGDLLDTRKYLNTAAEKAQSAGNFELAKNIRALKKAINEEADRVITEGGPGSKEAAAAKKIYEEEYAPFFAEGFGRNFRDKVQKDPSGRTQLPPSETAGFFLKNSEEAAGDLKRITSIAKDPKAAATAVSNYMSAQLANLVKADGTLEPATMRKWMDNQKAVFKEFPEAKQQFDALYQSVLNGRTTKNIAYEKVQQLAKNLKAAEKNVGATERRINDSVLRTLIDNEPVNAAAKILGDGDPEARMRETLDMLGNNKPAREAFKRAVADHLENRFTGTRTEQTGDESYAVLQSKVEAFMKKPGVEKALAELYKDTPGAMNNLRVAQRIGRDIAKANIQSTAGSPTAELSARREGFMRPLEAVLKAKFGALRGGSYMRSIKLARETIPGLDNDAAIQRLIVRAQLEPELALHLYGRNVEKMPARLWTKKLNRLLGYSAMSREITDKDDE